MKVQFHDKGGEIGCSPSLVKRGPGGVKIKIKKVSNGLKSVSAIWNPMSLNSRLICQTSKAQSMPWLMLYWKHQKKLSR